METIEAIKTRRSVRKFKSDVPAKEIIEKVVEAGTWAATAKNQQSPIIIAVTNPEIRAKIAEENRKIGGWREGFDPFYGAPVILIVLADKTNKNHVYDGSLVMGNLMLAAHDLGLASCWINRAREMFELPEWQAWLREIGVVGDYAGIGNVALGFADGAEPEPHARKANWVTWVE